MKSKYYQLTLLLGVAFLLVLIFKKPFNIRIVFTRLNPKSEVKYFERNESLLSIEMVIIPFLDYNIASDQEAVTERLADYKLSLKKNLAHPFVVRIHLLTTNYTETAERFKEFMLSEKIVVAQVKSVDIARDPWEYISNNLVGKDVMYSNANVYLGRGFEQVDAIKQKQNNIMYALSRHIAPENELCKHGSQVSIQDECALYRFSHGVFLFHLYQPLTEEFFEKLIIHDHTVVHRLGERIIWLFTKVLKHCVLNPCSILEVFHYHCSHLRTNIPTKRLEYKYRESAPPTKNMLQCN